MKLLEKNPFIMIVVGIFGIALSSIFVRYSQAPSAVTAAYRLLWTVVLLTPFVLTRKSVRSEFRSISPRIAILSAVSGLFLAAHFVLWFESLQHTSVASSTTIVCTEVVWVALGFCLLLKGKLSGKAVLAIAVSLAGSVMIALSDSSSGSGLYGDILALLAAISVAVYTLIGQLARKSLSTSAYTFIVYISCATALVLTCLFQGESFLAYGISPVIVGLLLAVFSTILGHSIFTWCLKYFSPAFVSASKLCEPVVAAIFAGILFSEIPGWLQLLGGVLVIAGVQFYSRIESQKNA